MHAYICGLDKMIKANRELLKSLGWDRKSILYEKYDSPGLASHPFIFGKCRLKSSGFSQPRAKALSCLTFK